jgi:hypothetical protein
MTITVYVVFVVSPFYFELLIHRDQLGESPKFPNCVGGIVIYRFPYLSTSAVTNTRTLPIRLCFDGPTEVGHKVEPGRYHDCTFALNILKTL